MSKECDCNQYCMKLKSKHYYDMKKGIKTAECRLVYDNNKKQTKHYKDTEIDGEYIVHLDSDISEYFKIKILGKEDFYGFEDALEKYGNELLPSTPPNKRLDIYKKIYGERKGIGNYVVVLSVKII